MTLTLRKEAVVETETVEEISERLLSHKDKCARCGEHVQAYFIFNKEDLEISFCGHHGRKHLPTLMGTGWDVLDFTDQINEKPSPSASGTEEEDVDLYDDDDDSWDY